MQPTVGSILKICLSSSEALYFKIIKIESSALAVQQICTVKQDSLFKERSNAPCSYIYRSELGARYVEVEDEEKEWLNTKYKTAS